MSEEKKPEQDQDLDEEQLETVSGGLNFAAPSPYLKIELTDVLVSSFTQVPGALEKKKL